MTVRPLRSWTDRRALHVQRACLFVADQQQAGIPIGQAIKSAAAKFRGRKLDRRRFLRLSAETLRSTWDRSDHGRDAEAFVLRYHHRPLLSTLRRADFLFSLLRDCTQRGLMITSAVRFMRRPLRHISLALMCSVSARSRSLQLRDVKAADYKRSLFMKTDKINVPRKPRIQGKIANLPVEQREQVHAWFRQNLTYSEICSLAAERFGLKIMRSSLCRYYYGHYAEIFGSAQKGAAAS